MQRASKPIRWLCLGVLLALVPLASAMPANSIFRARSRAAAPRGNCSKAHPFATRRAPRHVRGAYRPDLRRCLRPRASPAGISRRNLLIPAARVSGRLESRQDEQRIPRQSAIKTAALQGIARDSAARGVVGAVDRAHQSRDWHDANTSTNADGVFRWTDLAPGKYLLLVQSDGFENLTRDDVQLDAGDVVTA